MNVFPSPYLSLYTMDNRFGKEYKLCHKKVIDEIFAGRKSVKKFPFLMHYQISDIPLERPFQVVISAPKRIFRSAVKRNRIKRVMREVFRHEKHILEEFLLTEGKYLTLFLVYTSTEEFKLEFLKDKFRKLIHSLIKDIK
jgi:ribonuclease P protein component